NSIATQRSVFGAMQGRMQHAIDFNEVYSENISAAKSHISDTDYASELSRLASSRILQQAGTAVLAQTNFAGSLTSTLLHSLIG
ncbi:MAG: flagellin, partial [Proteobacteria bacterium]|nr:flagellin [Pseudomonadota bacterium]